MLAKSAFNPWAPGLQKAFPLHRPKHGRILVCGLWKRCTHAARLLGYRLSSLLQVATDKGNRADETARMKIQHLLGPKDNPANTLLTYTIGAQQSSSHSQTFQNKMVQAHTFLLNPSSKRQGSGWKRQTYSPSRRKPTRLLRKSTTSPKTIRRRLGDAFIATSLQNQQFQRSFSQPPRNKWFEHTLFYSNCLLKRQVSRWRQQNYASSRSKPTRLPQKIKTTAEYSRRRSKDAYLYCSLPPQSAIPAVNLTAFKEQDGSSTQFSPQTVFERDDIVNNETARELINAFTMGLEIVAGASTISVLRN